ncbi:molybdopterin converting factor subunit 1 [Oceanicoccus sp. KOV_DT_Chl]|uniref:molybdopterin converting factor subunit 1 n=1 Tax=Oceanicoccus sp. KOV_DT_Chl TaxID=1904639 RepID=UPI000C7D8BC9|nr:molybdopterin converting factor subunit 1 [Oceanicoccus sp. KOV_DT_Chl]
MLTILFFARIREQLGVDQLSLPLSSATMTIDDLLQQLVTTNEPYWAEVLLADNVVKAVNQQVVKTGHVLSDDDEVAFFPPVTGG